MHNSYKQNIWKAVVYRASKSWFKACSSMNNVREYLNVQWGKLYGFKNKKKLNSSEIVDINVFIEEMDLVGKSKENIV